MAEVSQKTKYVKLDDGVSFALVRTNPKLTTNTKLMYNGKKMYMESYASSELLNRTQYKNVSVKSNSTYNKDIANFLTGSGTRAYDVYKNFSDTSISSSYDNQFENMYWCGAEYIDSSFYDEEIGFVAPLYLREKRPNYFVIFRIDTPSNYNFNVDDKGNKLDSEFDFKKDILDKAVLIKTFDLREGSVLGNYIHNYISQEDFEFDKSMYVNFSNGEVTYYGIDKVEGILVKRIEDFNNELLKTDNPVLEDDRWFTEGFERNSLIFPYIMNIEYLFDDETFKNKDGGETYDFARYIGLYCNTIEFGEFSDLSEFIETEDNVIYYFEDNKNNLHRYIKKIKTNDGGGSDSGDSDNVDDATEYEVIIDGKDIELFDKSLISGFEKERVTAYAEPLDIYEGFINRAQYGFEILEIFEPGDWVGIEYNGRVECYFADNINRIGGKYQNMKIGEIDGFRFSVSEKSTKNDIAEALVKCVNNNKKSKFEAKYSDNVVVFYAKREGKEYNGSEDGGAKILLESSLIYNKKISLPISNYLHKVSESDKPIEDIYDSDSDSDIVIPLEDNIQSLFGDYYIDYFCGACDEDIDIRTDTYKNIFKIYSEEYEFFDVNRYLKTNNGDGRRICSNMIYVNSEGKIDSEYRLVIIDNISEDKIGNSGYDVSVSSTYQVEIMDIFNPNHGVLSWFPVKDFDFDINYSSYGQYGAFVDECNELSKKITYKKSYNINKTSDSDTSSNLEDSMYNIKKLAKSPFFDDYDNSLETEYDYYLEQYHPDLCLNSKSVPYISKWGYFDEQKDSCENPYRLNVSKVFGVSNLSSNMYISVCDENEYTHGMPYYMTFDMIDYQKDYQYIKSDDRYLEINTEYIHDNNNKKFCSDCVDYWIKMFMDTDEDMFSYFFSGKKYGKRFDRKYSRLLGGNKFNNPSTLFRGVKFEAVRQYSGVEKKSGEYNDYKFSFVYIPISIDSIFFSPIVYFVKNDTFKFIVGIVFVNTMLGQYYHNIFNGNIDYFNKGFLYSGCKDLIYAEGIDDDYYQLTIGDFVLKDDAKYIWEEHFKTNKLKNEFYAWIETDETTLIKTDTNIKIKKVFITKNKKPTDISDIIGVFDIFIDISDSEKDLKGYIKDEIGNIKKINEEVINEEENTYTTYNSIKVLNEEDICKIEWKKEYIDYDATIYGYKECKYYDAILCNFSHPELKFENEKFIEMCDNEWKYFFEEDNIGYILDVSKIQFKEGSLRNVLMKINDKDSIIAIKIHNNDGDKKIKKIFVNSKFKDKNNIDWEGERYECEIIVDTKNMNVKIIPVEPKDKIGDIGLKNKKTFISSTGDNKESINELLIDVHIKDKYDIDFKKSLGLSEYFSVFNQISMFNIKENINNDKNVKYYSTIEDNKYKIRVVEPDCIEIEDLYESIPTKVMQNNKSVVGTITVIPKNNVDKIGIKTINRYSGFYNPIFNDILYYDDYSYVELPYSNTNIDYIYDDGYGKFGIIKNMYYHKTNISKSHKILTSTTPIYPAINEYALGYKDYNIFSSNWDSGYFVSQDDLNNSSECSGIGSMKDGLCMFGSKYLNVPDYILIDTFENGKLLDDRITFDIGDDINSEILYKEINNKTVKYNLLIEKRLKRYLKEKLIGVFSKYINKDYSFGNKGTIEDDVEEYVEKNLLKLYKVEKVHMYIKEDRMKINDKNIENEYLKYVDINNELKEKNGFDLKDSKFSMSKNNTNEFDRTIIYNLKPGFKENFGFSVSIRRK